MKKRKPTPLQRDVDFVLDIAHDLPFMRRFLRRLVREAVIRTLTGYGFTSHIREAADRIAEELVP